MKEVPTIQSEERFLNRPKISLKRAPKTITIKPAASSLFFSGSSSFLEIEIGVMGRSDFMSTSSTT